MEKQQGYTQSDLINHQTSYIPRVFPLAALYHVGFYISPYGQNLNSVK